MKEESYSSKTNSKSLQGWKNHILKQYRHKEKSQWVIWRYLFKFEGIGSDMIHFDYCIIKILKAVSNYVYQDTDYNTA